MQKFDLEEGRELKLGLEVVVCDDLAERVLLLVELFGEEPIKHVLIKNLLDAEDNLRSGHRCKTLRIPGVELGSEVLPLTPGYHFQNFSSCNLDFFAYSLKLLKANFDCLLGKLLEVL